LNSSRKNPVPI